MALVPGPRRLAVVAALVVLGLGAGCAGSGYSYHSNQDEKLYFKVPDDWTVFDTGDLVKDDAAADEIERRAWVRGFVGGEPATTDAVWSITYEQPRGFVEVLALDGTQRDGLSLATLRGTNFGTDTAGNPVDPLAFERENPGGPLHVLGYEDVVLKTGPHGVHIRVAITPDGSPSTAIIDQTVLVDKATTKRYVLNIGCSSPCWDAHHKEIQEVIDSWTLEATT